MITYTFSQLIKKKLRSSIIILIALFLVSGGIIIAINSNNKRLKFEKYLNDQYKKIPVLTEKDLQEIAKPDRPDKARIRDFFMTMDPEWKEVPSYRTREAYEKTIKLRNSLRLKSGGQTIQWHEEPANMGGRTRTVMFDPNNINKVWAGGVTGGLWVNNDIFGQEPWIPVGDCWDNLSISSMTYDPNNTQIFYVGTGESQTALSIYRESSGRGFGLMKSYNGGSTWNLIESTKDWAFVSDVVVRIENSNSVVYAGVLSGKYQGNHQSQPTDGLYRSIDGGETWQQVLPNIEGKDVPYAPSDIEILSDNSKIFVGTTYNLNNDGASCILSSYNGTDWTVYSDHREKILNSDDENIPGRVMLTSSQSNPSIIIAGFAAGEHGRTGGYVGYNCPYILKSINKGSSWDEMSLPSDNSRWAGLAWHALTFAVQPDNHHIIWAGGLDLWRSINGGLSWTRFTNWAGMYSNEYSPTYVHADQHVIVYQPGSSEKMLFGNDGGVFCTYDGTLYTPQFYEKNQSYNTLQYYSCAIHPQAGAEHYIGGLQDNGSMYYKGNPIVIYDMLSGGDGALCFIDENDPLYMITSSYYNSYSLYVAPVSGNASQSGSKRTNNGVFINPADYDSEMNILYANAQGESGSYRADQLMKIKNFLTSRDVFYLDMNTGTTVPFSCVKVSPHSPDNTSTVYLGTQSGRLFKVENAHEASPQITEIGSPDFPTGYLSSIDVGANENKLVVTFSNYGVPSVFYTADGGVSWTPKEFNLPDMPVRSVLFHPENDDQVMLGTDFGVWTTKNIKLNNIQWEPSIDGLPLVRIDQIKIRKSDNTVLAGTHGRGLFTGIWPMDPTSGAEEPIMLYTELNVFPNPTNDHFNIEFTVPNEKNIQVYFIDELGRVLLSDKEENFKGKFNKSFNVGNFSSGTYFVRAVRGNKVEIKKLVVY